IIIRAFVGGSGTSDVAIDDVTTGPRPETTTPAPTTTPVPGSVKTCSQRRSSGRETKDSRRHAKRAQLTLDLEPIIRYRVTKVITSTWKPVPTCTWHC
ncbi:hypothetical protein RRG08_033516, partial [Elysia crispata]